jgi:hypothetical protein
MTSQINSDWHTTTSSWRLSRSTRSPSANASSSFNAGADHVAGRNRLTMPVNHAWR